MLQRIHGKLGTAGFILSIVALVAALGGGAYAASGGLTGKQKKEVEQISKKFAGKKGATGATGAVGPAGSKGDAGAPGAQGAAGTPGAAGAAGKPGEKGKEGSPWTAGGVLPELKTETGTFAYAAALSAGRPTALAPISFTIPLAAPLADGHVHLLTGDGTEEITFNEASEEFEAKAPTGCGNALNPVGTAANPQAAPGQLCVYVAYTVPPLVKTGFSDPHLASNYITSPSSTCETIGCLPLLGGPGDGAGTTGAILQVSNGSVTGEAFYRGSGSWAVTAPE